MTYVSNQLEYLQRWAMRDLPKEVEQHPNATSPKTKLFGCWEMPFSLWLGAGAFLKAPDFHYSTLTGWIDNGRDSRCIELYRATPKGSLYWLGVSNTYGDLISGGAPLSTKKIPQVLEAWGLSGARWTWAASPVTPTCPWPITVNDLAPASIYWFMARKLDGLTRLGNARAPTLAAGRNDARAVLVGQGECPKPTVKPLEGLVWEPLPNWKELLPVMRLASSALARAILKKSWNPLHLLSEEHHVRVYSEAKAKRLAKLTSPVGSTGP